MTFLWIWMFALVPLPLLVYKFWPQHGAKQSQQLNGALQVPFFEQLQQQAGTQSHSDKTPVGKLLLLLLAWILLVTALARPALVGKEVPLSVKGRDLMLAIDLSGSMDQRDLGTRYNRLDVVKSAADNFIAQRVGDRLGLILFSDRAYLQAPLTFDRQVVQSLLKEAQVGLTGQKTAIGDAIAIALKRLREHTSDDVDKAKDSRVLVLLTDGANNAGVMEPLKAAEIAKKMGIKIYTIGVGSKEQVVNTLFGQQTVQNRDLDEKTLTDIAKLTDGKYFRANDAEGLAKIYQYIDELEPAAGEPIYVRPTVDLYHYPAATALGLLMLMVLWQLLSNNLVNFRKNQFGDE